MNLSVILNNLRIKALNELQEAALNRIKPDHDTLILAPTGSGKTIAFLLPVVQQLKADIKGVQCLILVPSRELVLQVSEVLKQMAGGFKITCCYGGHAVKTEVNNLIEAPALLVGTPGRIAYHMREQHIEAGFLSILVLDEFDKCLSLGFSDDMSYIISRLKGLKQRILISATQMKEVPGYTGFGTEPVVLDFLDEEQVVPKLNIKKVLFEGYDQKEMLFRLICKTGRKNVLIFCNRREIVDELSELLIEKDLIHEIFHGGMEQDERERALVKFRNGSVRILVATDLASRGLDIPELECIIHYQLPETAETFLHRNGRTARMHMEGTVYMMMSADEVFPFADATIPIEDVDHFYPVPEDSEWKTLYVSAGRKDKVNKIDIAGLFLKKGGLAPADMGLIEVKDRICYVAVKRNRYAEVVEKLNGERLKRNKIKIEAAL